MEVPVLQRGDHVVLRAAEEMRGQVIEMSKKLALRGVHVDHVVYSDHVIWGISMVLIIRPTR